MPKFFLNIRVNSVGIADGEGQEFDSAAAAIAEAEASARDLIGEAAAIALGPRKGSITVTDETGHVVATVSFSSSVTVLRATPKTELPEN
ncbi:hypothetical protein WDZ92_13605 [Nostoc sp. NIES-2111]